MAARVFGPLMTQNGVDTIGLPDLIVDTKSTQSHWLVRVEDLPSNFCSVAESNYAGPKV